MIKGIPYFGDETQEIYDKILRVDYTQRNVVHYNSMYDIIKEYIGQRIIIVIDNKWLSWLNDIVFNYRDKECYIPYYTYELFKIEDKIPKDNNKGHLILKDGALWIRYNYNFKKYYLDGSKLLLKCFNLDTGNSFLVSTCNWIYDKGFDIDKLYKLYIESSYVEDDFDINKHAGGYHYIERSPVAFKNKEKELQLDYMLPIYSEEFRYEHDYRDVRNFKYNEVITKCGMLSTTDLYRERRLKFESYLYCCIRKDLMDNIKFNKGIYKYGGSIKLIIKDYWIKDKKRPNKTWCK